MATIEEIAGKYAKNIKRAVKRTELTKTASSRLITEAFIRKDYLLETLKEIQENLESLAYSETQEPLSEEDKVEIIKATGKILGLSKPIQFRHILKEASNENAIELSTYISQFLDEIQERMREEERK